MKAKEMMTKPVITIDPEQTLQEAADLMLKHGFGGLVVASPDGEIQGMLTKSDFVTKEKSIPFSTFRAPQLFGKFFNEEELKKVYEAAANLKVKEVMTEKVAMVSPEDDLSVVLDLMLKRDVNRLPVAENNKAIGIISRSDLLKLVSTK